jgi:hypothetical protein
MHEQTQRELMALAEKVDDCLTGQSKATVLLVLLRAMAATIHPLAVPEREGVIKDIAKVLRTLTDQMDRYSPGNSEGRPS